MSRALKTLLSILDIETLEVNLFRGVSPQVGWQRVFGGQVIGQALVAAYRTVNGRPAHSLHGYFLREGDPSVPILYNVTAAASPRAAWWRSSMGRRSSPWPPPSISTRRGLSIK
jgi:acyl-CoA thioesterase